MKITVRHTVPRINIVVKTEHNTLTFNHKNTGAFTSQFNRTPVNLTVNKLDDDFNGWSEFINTQLFYNSISDNNGVILNSGQWIDLPLRDDAGIKSQQTQTLNGFIDSDTNEIISTNLYDYFLARFDFKIKCALANRRGEIEFYLPNTTISFNKKRFLCADDASDIERPFITMPFFTGWVNPQKARVRIRIIDGDGVLYGVGVQFKQMHNGKNI